MASKTKTTKADWVVMGGNSNEAAYCQRCGMGLRMVFPVEIPVMIAAIKAFMKSHAKCKPTGKLAPIPATLSEWAIGRDTGTSSLTLYAAATGARMARYDIPLDPSDFGRCYRLLKQFPEIQADAFRQVATLCQKWNPFVKHWQELTALYEEELPSGTCPKLYKRMRELEAR